MRKLLVVTGGGDCPGLNTVIRGIVKAAHYEKGWEIWGSMRSFQGMLEEPPALVPLDMRAVAGIHVRGGTILQTTNKDDPFHHAVTQMDGSIAVEDCSDKLINRLKEHQIDAVINIGGEGSQSISQRLFEKGVNIVGVPKTIDNDLYATELTFGFQTAVEICTEAVDKLVTTAESHNRVIIAEVMGRDAGWIALYTAIASGAEIVLIPEIPYDIHSVVSKIKQRISSSHLGFAVIVVAEGARPIKQAEEGVDIPVSGSIAYQLMHEIKALVDVDVRVSVLGHIQRGGTPIAFDRVMATQMGVKAFELVKDNRYGYMVAYHRSTITSVPIKAAISVYNYIDTDNYLLRTARKIGVCVGDSE